MSPGLHVRPGVDPRLHSSKRPLDCHVQSCPQPADRNYSGWKEGLSYTLDRGGCQKKPQPAAYGKKPPVPPEGSEAATMPANGLPSSSRSMVSRVTSDDAKISPR